MTQRFLKTGVARAALAGLLLAALVGVGFIGAVANPGARLAAWLPAAAATVTATTSAVAPTVGAEAATATPTLPPAAGLTATPPITATATPADPLSLLNPFDFLPLGGQLVKQAPVSLRGDTPLERLLTVSYLQTETTTQGQVVTPTVSLLIAVGFDSSAQDWSPLWQTVPIVGTAQILPDTSGPAEGSRTYQGGDLLRTGQPILLLRTTEAGATPGGLPSVSLRLWAWTGQGTVPLRMVGPDGQDHDAVFTGSSDVQTADLDDDGVIEILVDNGPSTTVYRWDKTHFVVRP